MKKVFFFLALGVLALSSCKEKEDSTAPVISSVLVDGVEAEEHEFDAGESFSVRVNATDNEALNQVKIEIHAADDGHTHGTGGEEEELEPNIGVWSDSKVVNLEGTSDNATVNFTIPNNVAGHWHVEVMLLDEDGNEAEEYITTIHAENASLPAINLTFNGSLTTDGELQLGVGSSLSFTGTVTDPDGIQEVHAKLKKEGATTYLWENEYNGNGAVSFDLNGTTSMMTDADHYIFEVHATDGAGMENIFEIHVDVIL
jgi:hypothetical protein